MRYLCPCDHCRAAKYIRAADLAQSTLPEILRFARMDGEEQGVLDEIERIYQAALDEHEEDQ